MDLAKRWVAVGAMVLVASTAWAGLVIFAPVTPWLPGDFYTLYSAVVAVVRGISPYDHAALAQIQQAELAWDAVALGVPSLPYFYPPWYVLFALPLATLPFRTAAVAWLAANFVLLTAGCFLVFRALHWRPGRLLFPLLAAATLFAPTLGDLVVGQYGMPVFLGVCLVGACAGREGGGTGCDAARTGPKEPVWPRSALVGLGLVLLTLKPQLGVGALLVACVWLLQRRRYRSLVWAGGLLAVLGAASFRVSASWPVEFITAQASFAAWAGVPFPIQGCETCSTVAALVEAAGISGALALVVDGVVVVVLVLAIIAAWRQRGDDLPFLLSLACVATVLGTPYLRNYDLVILLLPFLFVLHSVLNPDRPIGRRHAIVTITVLGAAYLLPLLGTFMGDRLAVGRSGVAMAGALLVLLLSQVKAEEVRP